MEKQCNCCGKVFQQNNGILTEDIVQVNKKWGYFSEKDGEYHSFFLCEQCYDRIVEQFQIPVYVSEMTELI